MSAGYRGNDIGRICKNILDRIAALPGVRSATFSENGLFYGPGRKARLQMELPAVVSQTGLDMALERRSFVQVC